MSPCKKRITFTQGSKIHPLLTNSLQIKNKAIPYLILFSKKIKNKPFQPGLVPTNNRYLPIFIPDPERQTKVQLLQLPDC